VALAKARIVDRGVATWHITVPFNRIGEEWGKKYGVHGQSGHREKEGIRSGATTWG
jgi:hypothetical protein